MLGELDLAMVNHERKLRWSPQKAPTSLPVRHYRTISMKEERKPNPFPGVIPTVKVLGVRKEEPRM
jgi:hypothetical protein